MSTKGARDTAVKQLSPLLLLTSAFILFIYHIYIIYSHTNLFTVEPGWNYSFVIIVILTEFHYSDLSEALVWTESCTIKLLLLLLISTNMHTVYALIFVYNIISL